MQIIRGTERSGKIEDEFRETKGNPNMDCGGPFKSERLNISVIYGYVEKVFRTMLHYSKGTCTCNGNTIVFDYLFT